MVEESPPGCQRLRPTRWRARTLDHERAECPQRVRAPPDGRPV